MITNEQAIKIMSSGFGWSSEEHRQIIDFLKQQEKVTKLLELYQKRFSFYNFDEDKQLREIKALEKQLEEQE